MKRILLGAGMGGLVVIGIAAYLVISELLFINNCELVQAKITKVEFQNESRDNDDANDYYTMDMRVLTNNKVIQLNFDTGFHDPKFEAGQIIDVYYNSQEPDKSEIKDLWNQWGGALICAGIFIFDFFIFLTIFSSAKKKQSDLITQIENTQDYIIH